MINISNLHFSYGSQKVFSGLDLHLQSGHVYGLLGKNGTGKSTLLRSIAGLLFPKKGKIDVMGFIPGKRSPDFLQKVFILPEEFQLPDITLDQLLKYHSVFYPAFNRKQFEKYISEFEIPEFSTLQEISYGQKKKVLISFCLACNTSLVLMDEPTNGLDILSKSQFRKVIAGALDENKCIIISTHQVKDLESMIDRITILDEGQILFDQDIETIARKLSFRISFNQEDLENAIYAESSLKGHVLITENTTADESKLDLEMLYKATILHREKINSVFKA
jgi:ABC-2 type transport system ATP-binding protein